METSVSNFKMTSHSRSLSLPNSSNHLVASVEEHLCRVRSCEEASSSLSLTSTCHKLDGLRILYESLDDLLQLPFSHQLERIRTWEDEILDGSLRLLEICGDTRDVYSMMNQSLREIESSLRRKRGSDIDNDLDHYMISKKKLNRMICKCLKELKRSEKSLSMAAANGNSAMPLVDLIKQVQETSLGIIESSLSFVSGPKSQPRALSLVSRVLSQSQKVSDISEIQKLDAELMLLGSKKSMSNKDTATLRTQNLLKQLGDVSSNIQEVAELLEVTFRQLLKARVSLLNILNH